MQPFSTFTSMWDMAVGQLNHLPDGRAGEITNLDGPGVMVRAWDVPSTSVIPRYYSGGT